MIQVIIHSLSRVVEILPGEYSHEELEEVLSKYKDYTFSIPKNIVSKQGLQVGAGYVKLVSDIDHN